MEPRMFITTFTSTRHLSVSWTSSIHTPTSHFLKIHLNIIHPSTPGSPKWSLSLKFPHQNLGYGLPLSITCHMPHPSHSRFYHPSTIGWAVQIIKPLIMYFSSLPYYLVPLGPKYSPQHPNHNHPQPTFLSQCERPSFTPIQNNRKIYSSVYLNL
jgi:hypothetical protein